MQKIKQLICAVLWLIPLAVLTGCGGGSGDSSGNSGSTLNATVNLSQISVTFPSDGQATIGPGEYIPVTFSTAPPSAVHVDITDKDNVIAPSKYVAEKKVDGIYKIWIPFNTNKAVGTYTGSFKIKLCQDIACTSTYSINNDTIQYNITVVPGMQITALVNGSPASTASPIEVKSGDTITFEYSEPVTWIFSNSEIQHLNVSTTTTSITSTLSYKNKYSGEAKYYYIYATNYHYTARKKIELILN